MIVVGHCPPFHELIEFSKTAYHRGTYLTDGGRTIATQNIRQGTHMHSVENIVRVHPRFVIKCYLVDRSDDLFLTVQAQNNAQN